LAHEAPIKTPMTQVNVIGSDFLTYLNL